MYGYSFECLCSFMFVWHLNERKQTRKCVGLSIHVHQLVQLNTNKQHEQALCVFIWFVYNLKKPQDHYHNKWGDLLSPLQKNEIFLNTPITSQGSLHG